MPSFALSWDLAGSLLSSIMFMVSFGQNQDISVDSFLVEFPFLNRTSEVHYEATWNAYGVICPLIAGIVLSLVISFIPICNNPFGQDAEPDELVSQIPHPGQRKLIWTTRLVVLASAAILLYPCMLSMPRGEHVTLDRYEVPFLWNCSAPWYVSCTYNPSGTSVRISIPEDSKQVEQFHDLVNIFCPISFSCSLFGFFIFLVLAVSNFQRRRHLRSLPCETSLDTRRANDDRSAFDDATPYNDFEDNM